MEDKSELVCDLSNGANRAIANDWVTVNLDFKVNIIQRQITRKWCKTAIVTMAGQQ